MFEQVGQRIDDDAAARHVASVGVVGALVGLVALGVVTAGLWTVRERVQAAIVDTVVEPQLFEADLTPLVAPEAPARRVARGSGTQSAGGGAAAPSLPPAERPPEPASPVVQAPAPTLSVEIPREVANTTSGQGSTQDDGEGGGHRFGGDQGSATGDPALGIRTIHHRQAEVKRRVQPQYPPEARGLALGEQRCTASVRIDTKGVPTRVDVADCDPRMHETTREALFRWRWYPHRVDGRAEPVRIQIRVVYREEP